MPKFARTLKKAFQPKITRFSLGLALVEIILGLLCLAVLAGSAPVVARPLAEDSRFFPETGKTLSGDFLHYWDANGGLQIFGFPITDPANETDANGKTVLTQWFERHRFELQPKPGGGTEVRLTNLGSQLRNEALSAGADGATDPDFRPATPLLDPDFPADQQMFVDQTKHNLRFRFLKYWKEHGGQERLGLPVSEERMEYDPETNSYYVMQWFEKARMEYHPEKAGTEFEVLLGLLGKEIKQPSADLQKRFKFQWKLGRHYSFLSQPSSVFVDTNQPKGNVIYVNDRASGRINKYDASFKLINYWYMDGGSQAIAGPKRVNGQTEPSSSKDAALLYSLAPFDGQAPFQARKIRKLLPSGEWQTLELKPAGDPDSDTPNRGLAIDSNENIYILKYAAYANFLVWKYDAKGNFINKYVKRSDVTDPSAIAVQNDKLYLADGSSAKYFIFDTGNSANPSNQVVSLPSGQVNGQNRSALSIAVDTTGQVLVGEYGKIARFDQNNTLVSEFATLGNGAGQIVNPVAMVTDLKGNLFVADPSNHRIQSFDSSGNSADRIEDEPYNRDYNLGSATAVAATSGTNSFILVADPVNNAIKKIDATGKFQEKFTAKRTSALAITPGGEAVYGLNTADGLITKYDLTSKGKVLQEWGGLGVELGKFLFPNSLAVAKDGSIFVADTGNRRIQKFDAKGTPLVAWGTNEFSGGGLSDVYSGPTSLAIDPVQGNIYVVDSARLRVLKFTPDGALLKEINQSSLGDNSHPFEPVALAAPPDTPLAKNQLGNDLKSQAPTSADGLKDVSRSGGIYIIMRQGIYKLNLDDKIDVAVFAKSTVLGSDGGDGNIHGLVALAIDGDGNIFTTDRFSRLQKFVFK